MFTPTHILIAPLSRHTLSLVASATVEFIHSKSSFDLLQLSVITNHAINLPSDAATSHHIGKRAKSDQTYSTNSPFPNLMERENPSGNDTISKIPSGDEFDVVNATVHELMSLGIPVASSIDDLNISAQSIFGDCSSSRAPIEWVLDVAIYSGLADRQQLYAPSVARGLIKKICYLRPVEADLSGQELLNHEVLIRFGALAEDLPYLPLDAPSLQCPKRAATSALYSDRVLSRRGSVLSRENSKASMLDQNLFDANGLPRIPFPVVYPIPLSFLLSFTKNILSSKFIYDQLYTITGNALHLPGFSPHALSKTKNLRTIHSTEFTPPPSPCSILLATCPNVPPCDVLPTHEYPCANSTPIDDADASFNDHDAVSLEEHLQHLHDHAHAAHDIHLSELVTTSGRTLAGIAQAFQRGQFSVPSRDYQRVLHCEPPAYIIMNETDQKTNGSAHTDWDESTHGPISDAEFITLAGGKFTIAFRTSITSTDS